MKKQQKCYIYTRVPTSMQVEGYSLDTQKDKLRTQSIRKFSATAEQY